MFRKDRVPPISPRQNLMDLFCEFSNSPIEFLQYDSGYYRKGQDYAALAKQVQQAVLVL